MSTAPSPLTVGTKIIVTKGCAGLGVRKGDLGIVTSIEELGADYSHQVRVGLQFLCALRGPRTGQYRLSVYATHKNRLSDSELALLGNVSGQRMTVRQK